MENRQYESMLSQSLKKLSSRSPEDLAEKAGVAFDKNSGQFEFFTLGERVRLSYPQFFPSPALSMWHHLTVLSYLDTSDGFPLGGEGLTLSQFKEGGLIRGASFDRETEAFIKNHLGGAEPKTLERVFKSLGGEIFDSGADLSARFYFMPRFPITLRVWFEDEEFPASGKALLNDSSEHYLNVEAAGAAVNLLMGKVKERLNGEKP